MALVVDMTTSKHIATTVHTHTYWRGSDDSGDDSGGCTKLITTTDAYTLQLQTAHLQRRYVHFSIPRTFQYTLHTLLDAYLYIKMHHTGVCTGFEVVNVT